MPKNSDATGSLADMMQSAQSLMATAPIIGMQGAHFWQAQDRVLEEFEKFSSAWFKRRHEGTREALKTSQRIAEEGVNDPAALLRILRDWQSHSMERIADDAKDCTEMMTKCTEALVRNEVQAISETVKTAKSASKSAPVRTCLTRHAAAG